MSASRIVSISATLLEFDPKVFTKSGQPTQD